MSKSIKDKVRLLVPFTAVVLTVVALLFIWTITGAILGAIWITGLASFVLQVYVVSVAIFMGLPVKIYRFVNETSQGLFEETVPA